MDESQKQEPDPLDESVVLKTALSRAAKGKVDEDLSISFRVSGGAPEQRYDLVFKTNRGRLDVCSLDCEMSHRHVRAEANEVSLKTIASLASELLSSDLLSTASERPLFLPDTLIGIIEISFGGTAHRTYFAADPHQAAVQDMTPPDPVLTAAEAFYEAAGRVLNIGDVRP
jgi:hypothetical protein